MVDVSVEQARMLAKKVIADLHAKGAIDKAVDGWVRATGRPRRQCVVFVAAPPTAALCFSVNVEGQPVACHDPDGNVAMRLFAVDVTLAAAVLRPIHPTFRAHNLAAKVAFERGVAPKGDLAVALISGEVVCVIVGAEAS